MRSHNVNLRSRASYLGLKQMAAVALLLIGLAGASSAAYAQATEWQKIPIPALPPFHPAEPKRVELPNGMVIFLQEDHELPLIDGSIRIRGGTKSEPAAKVGLVDLYGEVWRTGGTKSRTGDELDDFLEARAAKVETGGSVDSTSLGWSCLKGDFDDVFRIGCKTRSFAVTSSNLRSSNSRNRSRAAMTILLESPGGKLQNWSTARIVLTPDRRNTRHCWPSSATICWPGTRPICTQTT